eukprot:scaffold32450_cov83-Phaeocystis_antarctica.AAC.1
MTDRSVVFRSPILPYNVHEDSAKHDVRPRTVHAPDIGRSCWRSSPLALRKVETTFPGDRIRVHRKTQAYIVCPPKGYAGGRHTQRSTFTWTVAGYHPIACRALLKVQGCGSWMFAFALGRSQKHICIHIRVLNSGHLGPNFCVRWFHPVVARLTAATSVGFHSCASRVSLFGLAINFE